MKKLLLLVLFCVVFLAGCEGETKYQVFLQPGLDIIEVNDPFIDLGCYVVGTTMIEMDVVSNSVDSTTVGEYTVEYEQEVSGKTYTCFRNVQVIDSTPPAVTLNPGIDTVVVGTSHTDTGVTVLDNSNSNNMTISTLSNVNINAVGNYEITYTVIDVSGNTTTVIRYVSVIEEVN